MNLLTNLTPRWRDTAQVGATREVLMVHLMAGFRYRNLFGSQLVVLVE